MWIQSIKSAHLSNFKDHDENSRTTTIKKNRQNLPILFISGKDDPFGEYGKGIKHLARLYKRAGIKHITVQLYKHKRHEILFEEDYLKTWQHMFEWMEKQILKNKSE